MGNYNNGIVIIDVDDTLIKGQSQQLLIKYLLKKGLVSTTKYFKIISWFIFYKLGFVSNPKKIAEYSFKLFERKTREEVDVIAKDFFQSVLLNYFYPEALEIIEKHKDSGRRVILLSNAVEIIIKEVSIYLDTPDYICTELEAKDNIYTGRIKGEVTYGKNKVEKIKNFLSKNNILLEDVESWGYGDHLSDIFVLELVKHPFVINPNKKLKEIAEKRKWGILKFKD